MDYNSKIVMLKGADGVGIQDFQKTATNVLTDTYTVTLSDGRKQTFNVTNGKGISSVKKTGARGLEDTYTITFNDGSSSTFTATNGKGITNIKKTGSSGLTDTYTITYNDGTTSTFTVTNGEGVQNLQIGCRNYIGNFNVIPTDSSEYDGLSEGTFIDRASTNTRDGTPAIQAYKRGEFVKLLNTSVAMIGTKQTYKFTLDDTFNELQFKFNNSNQDANVSWDLSKLEKGEYIFSFAIVKPGDSGTGYGMTAKYIKLERGNIATDWTPAPEDLTDTPITNTDIDTILNS